MAKLFLLFGVILCLIPGAVSAEPGRLTDDLTTIMEEQRKFEEVILAQARVNQHGGQLSDREMRILLELTGWEESDIDTAMQIAWCESRYSPYAAGDGGRSLGLFQLNYETWYRYAGFYGAPYSDIVINSLVAKKVWDYDKRKYGYPRQWSCAAAAR